MMAFIVIVYLKIVINLKTTMNFDMFNTIFSYYSTFSGVYLCGHSAGAHLAALMLLQNWLEETMVSDSMIKGNQYDVIEKIYSGCLKQVNSLTSINNILTA